MNTSEISGLWSALGEIPQLVANIEEIDELAEANRTFCLLKGENLIAGTIGDEEIHVVTGTTVTALKPSEITSMRRSYEGGSELEPSPVLRGLFCRFAALRSVGAARLGRPLVCGSAR